MSELFTPTVVLALLTMAVGAGLAIILAVRGAGEPTAADPPVEPRDHYVMVELLHQCRRCKAGVPLNGPLERAHCGDCSSDLDLDANRVWAVFAGLGESRAGQGHTQFNLVTEMTWKVEEPRCHAC
jgi:ribosomal protein S27AE